MDQEDLRDIQATNNSTPSPAPKTDLDSPGDSGLRCPHCDYNLTGLTDERCPECGEPYSRDELTALLRHPNRPILKSFSPEQPSFKTILGIGLFDPVRIGKELDVGCDRDKIAAFGLSVKLTASAAFALLVTAGTGGAGICPGIAAVPVAAVLADVVERILGTTFASLLEPIDSVPRDHRFKLWHNLCRCFGGFLVVTGILGGVALMAAQPPWPMPLAGMTTIVSILWWWLALSRAVCARSKPGIGRVIALAIIPIIGAASVLVGLSPIAILVYLAPDV